MVILGTADTLRMYLTMTNNEVKNPLKVEAGRKGGQATLYRYGRAQLAQWGKLGGAPRWQRDYHEIRQQRFSGRTNNNKEAKVSPGGANLGLLRRAYKLRDRSSPGETEPAGITQETPQEVVPARKDAAL